MQGPPQNLHAAPSASLVTPHTTTMGAWPGAEGAAAARFHGRAMGRDRFVNNRANVLLCLLRGWVLVVLVGT